MLRADRDGYLYVMDRTTGEVITADPFVHITSTKGVDTKTGKPIENEAKKPSVGTVIRDVCPAAPGGKDWQPTAYSPQTGLLYIPANNLCMDFEGVEASYIAGTPYVGANVRMYAGPGGNRGEFIAWDPVNRRKAWSIKEEFPVWSGVVATAGDVVFSRSRGRYATAWRTATESISRVMPLKNMLTPTSVPIAQTELIGQALPIIAASTSVTMPSNNNHPLPGSGRS